MCFTFKRNKTCRKIRVCIVNTKAFKYQNEQLKLSQIDFFEFFPIHVCFCFRIIIGLNLFAGTCWVKRKLAQLERNSNFFVGHLLGLFVDNFGSYNKKAK
jgi:hypothetical protein